VSATKALRRLVSHEVQHEVVRKMRRGSLAERLAKALVEYEDYPTSSRQMLIDSLACALPPTGALHEHQRQMLAIVRDVICRARGRNASLWDGSNARLQVAAAAAATCEAEREASAGTQAMTLRDGPLRVLLTGSWQILAERDAAMASLHDFLRQAAAGESLIAALPCALGVRPADRSGFKDATAKAVEEFVDQFIKEVQERTLSNAVQPVTANGTFTLSPASARLLTRRAEDLESATADLSRHDAACLLYKAADQMVSEQRKLEARSREDCKHFAKRGEEFDDLIEALDEVVAKEFSSAIGDVVGKNPASCETSAASAEPSKDVATGPEALHPCVAPEATSTLAAALEPYGAAGEKNIPVKEAMMEGMDRDGGVGSNGLLALSARRLPTPAMAAMCC